MTSVILSQTFIFSETILQSPVVWPAIDLICVTIFFLSLFYSNKREFVISCFNDCSFCFSIFGTVVLFWVGRHGESYHYRTDIVKMYLSVTDVENSLLIKVIYILSNSCRQSGRSMRKLSATA